MTENANEPQFCAAILRALPDGIMMLAPDGALVSVNDALTAMTGFLPSELTCERPPCWTDETRAALLEAAASGDPTPLELTFLDQSGAPVPVSVRFVSLTDEQGRRVALVRHVGQERAKARAARRWRAIAESPFEYVVVIDRNYRYTYVNHPAEGVELEDLLGKATPFDFVDSTHHDQMRAAFDKSLEEGVATSYEVNVPSLGRSFASVVAPIKEGGEVTGLALLTHDVTDRDRAMSALCESEERLRLVIEGADVGAFSIDLETGTAYYAPQFYSLLGYEDGAEALVAHISELDRRVHPDDAEATSAAVAAALADGTLCDVEYRLRTASGHYRWFRGRGRKATSPSGVVRFAGFITDITARKQLAAEALRTQAQQRTAQRLEELGRLASGIAHDFNNLLVPILGNLELAVRELGGDHAVLAKIQAAELAARRAQDIVRKILSFARPSSEQRTATDVAAIAEEVVDLVRSSGTPNISLEVVAEEGLTPIYADPTQVRQMLANLVTNAVHACGARPGRVDVSLSPFEIDQTFATRHRAEPGPAVRITVRDDGVGMDAHTLDRALTPFFTTKPAGEGTGLGMAIVEAAVRRHKGALSLESQRGVGTTVSVFLPLGTAESSPSVTSGVPSSVPPAPGPLRIACVDDEAPVLRVLVSVLESAGHKVTPFTRPTELLDAVRAAPDRFDVVVSDLTMPRLKGPELARQLVAVRTDLPVVIVSGWGAPQAEHAENAPNIRAWVEKPFSREVILEAIGRAAKR